MNIIKKWNGRTIRVRDDRYVSLSDMAQASGKLFGDWKRLKSTESYLTTLSGSMQIPIDRLIQSNESNGSNDSRGTWGHPKVSIRFAQWCSDEFAVQVDMWIDELMTTGSVSLSGNSQKFIHNLEWYDRLLYYKARTKIEVGYFSIFEEINNSIISELEHAGYTLPIGSVPDISVGQCFCNHLRSIGYNLEKITKIYTHYYPDGRVVKANVYSDEVLAIFRKWLQLTYKTTQFPKYLKGKDPQALPTLNQLLGFPAEAI